LSYWDHGDGMVHNSLYFGPIFCLRTQTSSWFDVKAVLHEGPVHLPCVLLSRSGCCGLRKRRADGLLGWLIFCSPRSFETSSRRFLECCDEGLNDCATSRPLPNDSNHAALALGSAVTPISVPILPVCSLLENWELASGGFSGCLESGFPPEQEGCNN
jgi:hypothetical protein